MNDIVKQNTALLQKCLKSKSKSNVMFFAAVNDLKDTVETFGPALNKHLALLLELI